VISLWDDVDLPKEMAYVNENRPQDMGVDASFIVIRSASIRQQALTS
jgi:hypothetical protein